MKLAFILNLLPLPRVDLDCHFARRHTMPDHRLASHTPTRILFQYLCLLNRLWTKQFIALAHGHNALKYWKEEQVGEWQT